MKQIMTGISLLLLTFFLLSCSSKDESPTATNRPDTSQNEPTEVPNSILELPELKQIEAQALAQFSDNLLKNGNEAFGQYDIFAVTFLWGSTIPSTSGTATDWSGGMSVNAVANIDLVHAIDFDDNEDYFTDRPNKATLEWVSFTAGDLDGVIALVAVDLSVEYFAAPFLNFYTGPFTKQFYFDELEKLSALYPLDNGNIVVVLSKALWRHTCPGGLVEGKWNKESVFSDKGTIDGIWNDLNGNPVGVMSGTYWKDSAGTGRLSGSLSGVTTDQIILEFSGRWIYDDYRMCPMCGAGHGLFWAKYTYLSDDTKGYMQGTFGDFTLATDELALPISGIWQDGCPHSFDFMEE